MTLPLTVNQEKVWRYLLTCARSPTMDEIASDCSFSSKSEICRIVDALEAKGFARRTPHRARSIVAVDPQRDLSAFETGDLAAELARRLAA